MRPVFISYSGSRIDRAALFYALLEHGISPWRDVESLDLGDDTAEVIEEELSRCSAVILWVNEDVLASDYVTTVELPIIAKAWRQGHLRLVPVFDGLSPSQGAERLSKLGIEVGETHGYEVDQDLSREEVANDLAARCVRAHVMQAKERGLNPVVRFVSYDDTAPLREEAVLNLDWRHRLAKDFLESSEAQRLHSALVAASGALKDIYGGGEVTLAVKAHLPLALALGHAFAEPTGCVVLLPREEAPWRVSGKQADAQLLDQAEGLKGPVWSRRASVEISVSRDVEAGVNAYAGDGHRYRHRVMLSPREGPGRDVLRDERTLNAWARQVGEVLATLSSRADVDQVDLFLATPVELAIAIGWWANAAGEVGLMNWTGRTGPYLQLWTLP